MRNFYTKKTGQTTRYWQVETNSREPINLIYTAKRKSSQPALFKSQCKIYGSRKLAIADAKRMIAEKLERGYQLETLTQEPKQPPRTIEQNVDLSNKNLNFLRNVYSSDWNVQRLRRELKSVTAPILLHYIAWLSAETLTWHDVGFEWPKSVLLHPNCDAGTALMIYWLGDPENAYSVEPDHDCNPNQRDLRKIENAYLNGKFRTAKIKFEPKLFLPKPKNRHAIRNMPYGMTLSSRGRLLKPLKVKNVNGSYIF